MLPSYPMTTGCTLGQMLTIGQTDIAQKRGRPGQGISVKDEGWSQGSDKRPDQGLIRLEES